MYKELVRPIKLWTGVDNKSYPYLNDQLVIDKYEIDVLEKIKHLFKEFSAVDIHENQSADKIYDILSASFTTKYDKIDKQIIDIFYWVYSYSFR